MIIRLIVLMKLYNVELIYLLLMNIPNARLYVTEVDHSDGQLISKNTSKLMLPEPKRITFDNMVLHHEGFNQSGHDIMVVLHIQKTAGTAFEKHLVYDLALKQPCLCNSVKRQCLCSRPNSTENPQSFINRTWLLSRFSTGWICGLHADWTQLNYCLRGLERLFLVTFLRNPLHRFISEFRHVQRGATWKSSSSHCSSFDTKKCFDGKPDWSNVTLNEFISCKYNMAINRQVYMLADYSAIGCSTKKSLIRDDVIVLNAMRNLETFSFFGLAEHQRLSQLIFEKTFHMTFKDNFKQSDDNTTKQIVDELPQTIKEKILEINHLDVRLYDFAMDLFKHRCKQLSITCDLN